MMKVEFFRHNIGAEEKQAVCDVLDSIFLTTGEQVYAFEAQLAAYVGTRHAVAVNSCTAALHLSLLALGIGPGDEVITTPMTFVATSLAIIKCGAKPVWVDVEAGTGNIDAGLIEAAISEKTKAILPVHLYGQMCDMVRIKAIADHYNLSIVEDAAHALESKRNGVGVGELSDAACFSFYATKSITAGEGGAVATNSAALADRLKILRLHGINHEAAERYTKYYRHWDLIDLGWKYNMDNIQAALLIPQLKKVETFRRKRQAIYHQYKDALERLSQVRLPDLIPDSRSGFHLFTIWVNPEDRDRLLVSLQQMGVGVAVNYRAIHLLTKFRNMFAAAKGDFPNAEKLGDATLSIPFYAGLAENEIDYVIGCLNKVLI